MRVTLASDAIAEQGLLIQCTLGEPPDYSFWRSNAPVDTARAELAAVALARPPIEHLLQEAKREVGMAGTGL